MPPQKHQNYLQRQVGESPRRSDREDQSQLRRDGSSRRHRPSGQGRQQRAQEDDYHVEEGASSRHPQRRSVNENWANDNYQDREGGVRGQAPRRSSAPQKRNEGREGGPRGNAPNRPRTPQPTHDRSASPRRASLSRSESKSFRAEPVEPVDDFQSEASSASQRSSSRRNLSKSRSVKLEDQTKERRSEGHEVKRARTATVT